MHTVVRCAALVAACVLGQNLFAQDAARSVPLVYTALAAPETVFSRPLESELAEQKPAVAAKLLDFRNGQVPTIDLCGESVSMTANGDGTIVVRAAGREQLLRLVPRLGVIQSAFFAFGDKRKYLLAFPSREGTGRETCLTYRAGAVQAASIDGQSIWFYDHNTDGLYTLGEDSVRVGEPTKAAVFAPLSSYVATPGGVYEIQQLAQDGTTLQYQKHAGKTGSAAVTFAGSGAEVHLVIASADGLLSAIVTGAVKPRPAVQLLPGRYEVVAAVVTSLSQGKLVSVMETASVPPIEITEGETTLVELGAPLALEFKADLRSATEVNIAGASMRIRGKAGEAYTVMRWSGQPEVSLVSGGAVRKLNRGSISGGQSGSCYSLQIPQIRAQARSKIVIAGAVEGLGLVRGESPLE